MGYELPPMSWLRAFEAAARLNSFTEAAAELGLTPSAISHQIRSLEGHLGTLLFERLPRKISLTEVGCAYLEPVRNSFRELAAASAGLFGFKGDAKLDIRAPVSFVAFWLAQRLARFSTAYPNISVRFHSTIWPDPLAPSDMDLDIRFGFGQWHGFRTELIFNEACVVASPINSSVTSVTEMLNEPRIHLMATSRFGGNFSTLAVAIRRPPTNRLSPSIRHLRPSSSCPAA